MAKFGCSAKFIAMVRQFHEGMFARVQNDGEFSEPFPVTNGVEQGCVLASKLFSMMFSAMLTDAFQDDDNGIPIRYRFDGKIFNLSRLQAKSKVQTKVLDEFLFADDMAKGAPTEEKMQNGVDQISDSCDSYDLTTSIKTTEVVYQPAPGKPYKVHTITVKGQQLQVVDKFNYLGSTLSRAVHIDGDVNARIAKATAAFGRLLGNIWDWNRLNVISKAETDKMCHFVLVFFSPFSIAITSLGEERANLSAFRTFVRFVLVWICRFPLPLGVWEGLRFVIVALPALFSYLFLTQNWKSTDLWCCQHYYTHAKLGQFTNDMPKDRTTSIQAVLEIF